jgi:hypothetical protein
MMEVYSDVTLASWMVWFQVAVVILPVMVAMAYLEYRDWRHDHPKQARRYIQTHRRTHPIIPFVVPH